MLTITTLRADEPDVTSSLSLTVPIRLKRLSSFSSSQVKPDMRLPFGFFCLQVLRPLRMNRPALSPIDSAVQNAPCAASRIRIGLLLLRLCSTVSFQTRGSSANDYVSEGVRWTGFITRVKSKRDFNVCSTVLIPSRLQQGVHNPSRNSRFIQ